MISAMDKGVEAAKLSTPPVGVFEGVDLRTLPKFISFKAALIKEKLTLQYVLAIHLAIFAAYLVLSRLEVHGLQTKLREKEYILAPGVVDFTPASPQTVSDTYVVNAAMSFVSLLGNINSVNIDEQYQRLATFMSPELAIQFEQEVLDWKEAVKTENISEILKVTEREVVADGNGNYQVTALARRERYSAGENLGYTDEVITMNLRLVPPAKGKEWYLEIASLKRSNATSLESKARSNNSPRTETRQ